MGPMGSFFDLGTNSYRAQDVRTLLDPAAHLAEQCDPTAEVVVHRHKNSGSRHVSVQNLLGRGAIVRDGLQRLRVSSISSTVCLQCSLRPWIRVYSPIYVDAGFEAFTNSQLAVSAIATFARRG